MTRFEKYAAKWQDLADRTASELRLTAPLGDYVILYRAELDRGVTFRADAMADEGEVLRKVAESFPDAAGLSKNRAA